MSTLLNGSEWPAELTLRALLTLSLTGRQRETVEHYLDRRHWFWMRFAVQASDGLEMFDFLKGIVQENYALLLAKNAV